MNSNGILSFDSPFTNCCPHRDFPLISPPLIVPLWLDFDLTGTSEGGIYYRQTEDPTYLELVHILLNNVENVGDLTEFFPTKLFIATWEKVPEYGGSTSVCVHAVKLNQLLIKLMHTYVYTKLIQLHIREVI